MDKIQIYDRKNNTWSKKYTVIVGFQEKWVLDKTTDTASDIRITVPTADNPLEWAIMDWVRIMHIPDGSHNGTYNADGTPINHNQYVISGIQCVEEPRYNRYSVSLTLIEPIERFRGIIGETLTYTNIKEKRVGNTTYYGTVYNHLTALERWLKLTPANCDSYASGYNKNNNISWYNRIWINNDDKAFLQRLPYADTTINGLSLYELLLDNYDSSTGRTPVAYFDIDPATDLPYNNERDEYLLRFERQDGLDKPELELSDLKHKATKVFYTKTRENYATGIVSDVENLTGAGNITYPAQSLFAVAEVDTLDRELFNPPYNKVATDYWVVKTPFPIKNVISLTEMEINKSRINTTNVYGHDVIERKIRNQSIYEAQEYSALGVSVLGGIEFSDNKLYWYKSGENKIHIRKYSSIDRVEPTENKGFDHYPDYLIQIEYEPLINARLVVGDQDYAVPVNQVGSQIDTEKYGAFLDNYLKGMNKADIVIQKTYGVGSNDSYVNYNLFKDLIGSRVKDGDKNYMITAVSYRNRNLQYDVFVQLNENHFRKSNNYEAGQEIKTNRGIPLENIKRRQITLNSVVSLNISSSVLEEPQSYIYSREKLLTALSPAILAMYKERNPQVTRATFHYKDGAEKTFLFPITKMLMKNQACITVNLPDNAEAGKEKKTLVDDKYFAPEYSPYTRSYSQIPVLYSDRFGEVESIHWLFLKIKTFNSSLSLGTVTKSSVLDPDYDEFDAGNKNMLSFMRSLPKYDGNLSMEDQFFSIQGEHLILKDSMEQLNVTFLFEAKAERIEIHSNLMKYSSILSENTYGEPFIRLYNERKGVSDSFNNQIREVFTTTIWNRLARIIEYNYDVLTDNFKCATIGIKIEGEFMPLLIVNDEQLLESIKKGWFNLFYR